MLSIFTSTLNDTIYIWLLSHFSTKGACIIDLSQNAESREQIFVFLNNRLFQKCIFSAFPNGSSGFSKTFATDRILIPIYKNPVFFKSHYSDDIDCIVCKTDTSKSWSVYSLTHVFTHRICFIRGNSIYYVQKNIYVHMCIYHSFYKYI